MKKTILIGSVALCGLFTTINSAPAQGTAFTYQGELTTSGVPATGSFDLAFTLFNTPSNGVAVAGPITNTATAISNGLFAVTLDFGPGIFTGPSYWLQISVQTNGGSHFATLTPLQPITPMPYAVFAPNAGAALTAGTANSLAAGGTVPLSALPGVVVTNGATNVTFVGSFTGNGGALTNLKGTNLSGTIPLASLPGATVTNGASGVTLTGMFNGNGGGLTGLNASQLSSGTVASSLFPSNAVTLNGLVTVQTNIYATNGTYSFTVPPGASRLIVKLWGAGGGAGTSFASGGGGAFVQKTIAAAAGQIYTIVVGQRGAFHANNLGDNGSGIAQGGNSGPNYGSVGGQGGQASSLFYFTGGNYILEAMAGGGGGGGNNFGGGAGGNPGANGPSDTGNSGGIGGNNGVGASGGGFLNYNNGYYDGGANGAFGANIQSGATTVGVASLGLVGGNGGDGANNGGFANSAAGGGGGGYGGGGGGAFQIEGPGYDGYGGGGGGSLGDSVVAGSAGTPGNTADPNYVSPNGGGGNNAPGSDGLAVVIAESPVANISGILNANGPLVANAGIILSNPVSNVIQFSQAGVAPPADNSAGWKIRTFIPGYGIGISPGAQWYSAVSAHQWWIDNSGSGTYSQVMQCDSGGNLSVSGNLISSGAVYSTNGPAGYYFNDRTSLSNYGQWALYAAGGKAYLYNTRIGGGVGNATSVDLSGNYRTAGTITASTSPDLAETIAAADNVEAGDIVCADPTRPESAIRCDKHSQGVLGVVSDGTGGFLINANGFSSDGPLTGKPLVLVGRVPVKVSLENGPIHIGDYLSPSSTPGVAMRGTDAGLVVGIALESYAAATDGGRTAGGYAKVLCFVKVGEANTAAEIKQLKQKAAKVDSLEKRVMDLEAAVQRLAK